MCIKSIDYNVHTEYSSTMKVDLPSSVCAATKVVSNASSAVHRTVSKNMFKLPNYSWRQLKTRKEYCSSVLPEASYPAFLSGDAVFLLVLEHWISWNATVYNNDGGFAALLSFAAPKMWTAMSRKIRLAPPAQKAPIAKLVTSVGRRGSKSLSRRACKWVSTGKV